MKYPKKQNGISLVELLIATAISLFLMGNIFTVYLSNKKAYQYNESLAYLQENSRLAFLSFSHDVHMARAISFIAKENALEMIIPTAKSEVEISKDGIITITKLKTIKYYLDKDKVNGKFISVLHRKYTGSPNFPSGLIDNVNSMQVFFYTQNNPTHESTPAEIHDWSKILGVKVILSLSSMDQHLHRQLSMVIALRNPLT
jgi:hypothetical protein